MNQLQVVSINGQLVTESREVARMVDRRHTDLMRAIGGYSKILTNAEMRSSEFFIDSTYQDGKGETRPCYLLTRKGCDMVANKMTGEKGVLFTAAYVTRFEELEKSLNAPKPLTEKEQLKASMRLSLETSEEVEVVKKEVAEVRNMVENQITLDHGEQRGLQRAIGRRVYEIESTDDAVKRKLFSEIHREIKDRFGVASYKDVKRKDLQAAIGYVNAWIPKRAA